MMEVAFCYAPIISIGAFAALIIDNAAAVLTVQTGFAVLAFIGAGIGTLLDRKWRDQ